MQITRDDRVRMERVHVLAWPALRVAGVLRRSSGAGFRDDPKSIGTTT